MDVVMKFWLSMADAVASLFRYFFRRQKENIKLSKFIYIFFLDEKETKNQAKKMLEPLFWLPV